MGVLDRAQERLLLVVTAVAKDGAVGHQLVILFMPLTEAQGTHLGGWTRAGDGIVGIGNEEGAILASQETCRVKGFQRVAFRTDFKFCPMSINAGTSGFFGPKVLAMTAPI
ncbi:MAG: hypothetical protein U0V70_15080 [Terriglobia bacterium]